MDDTAKLAFNKLAPSFKDLTIPKSKLQKEIKKNSLLIITDTTDEDRLQIPVHI